MLPAMPSRAPATGPGRQRVFLYGRTNSEDFIEFTPLLSSTVTIPSTEP